jgi:hypothetical protein
VLVTDYGARGDFDKYKYLLMDESCNSVIKEIEVDSKFIGESTYLDFHFEKIADSMDKRYCFSIKAEQEEPMHAIGVYIANPKSDNAYEQKYYKDGSLIVNGVDTVNDAVFRLYYEK